MMAGIAPMNRKFEVVFKIDHEDLNTRVYVRRADGPNHAVERAGRQLQRDAMQGLIEGTTVTLFSVMEIECEPGEYHTPDGVTVVTL